MNNGACNANAGWGCGFSALFSVAQVYFASIIVLGPFSASSIVDYLSNTSFSFLFFLRRFLETRTSMAYSLLCLRIGRVDREPYRGSLWCQDLCLYQERQWTRHQPYARERGGVYIHTSRPGVFQLYGPQKRQRR